MRNGIFIGRAGLEKWDDSPDVELGYSFKRNYWGQGYATEVARVLLNWGFEHTKLSYITALAVDGNTASHRILECLGMHIYEQCSIDTTPVLIYKITRELFTKSQLS